MKTYLRILFALLCCITFAISCKMAAPTQGAYLTADAKACMGCAKCVAVCNADAIVIVDRKAIIDPVRCVECGKCVTACPYEAIW